MFRRVATHLRSQWLGLVAVFIALGGTGYAAVSIPRHSISARQLKNGAVTSSQDAVATLRSDVAGLEVEEDGGVSGVPVEEAALSFTMKRFTSTRTSIEPKRTRIDSVEFVDVADDC